MQRGMRSYLDVRIEKKPPTQREMVEGETVIVK